MNPNREGALRLPAGEPMPNRRPHWFRARRPFLTPSILLQRGWLEIEAPSNLQSSPTVLVDQDSIEEFGRRGRIGRQKPLSPHVARPGHDHDPFVGPIAAAIAPRRS